jgi:hypothetical protein
MSDNLEFEGRRRAEAAYDHSAALDLRPTILQALGCLDRGVELSCRASADLNRFVQENQNAQGSLDCVQGLDWLRLRLAARDAVRSTSVARWVKYIWEHSTDIQWLELGNALDEGLRVRALGEQLSAQYRDVLVGWLTEAGVQRDQAYEDAVQQLLR